MFQFVMTDILTLVFRTFMTQTEARKELAVAPPSPEACSALLLGDSNMSRSVLLLAAVTAASETGVRVMFFTQTRIQSVPVCVQRCVPGLSTDTLKKITFSYPRTVEELLQQVAGLHEGTNTSPVPPSLIIVDKLEGFLCGPGGGSHCGFHPGEQSRAAHLSALLCDTAAFLTQLLRQRRSGSAPCRIVASFQSGVGAGRAGGDASATDPILDVLDRYFQGRCTLERDGSHGAGLQEVWHVYLSGTGVTEDSQTKDCEDRAAAAEEWQLLIFPDGLMEFKLV